MYQVILASNSPRRKEILDQVGVNFSVVASTSEEKSDKENPIDRVEELAIQKAKEVASKVKGPAIIIGADTLVAHGDTVLGKPKDVQEAKKMLMKLQDNAHEVYTGVCVVLKDIQVKDKVYENTVISFADVSRVIIWPMTGSQVDQYIATGEPMDKAGAYAIQGKFAVYVKEIIGDYYNIVGLPISKIHRTLLDYGIDLLQHDFKK